MDIHLTFIFLGVFVSSCQSLLPAQSYSLISPSVYHYPDLTNCHIFYHFDQILLNPKTCGDYMMFNPVKKVCDWPEKVAQIRPECQQKPIIKYNANPERAYPKSRFRKNRRLFEKSNPSQSLQQRNKDNKDSTVEKTRSLQNDSKKQTNVKNKEMSTHYKRTHITSPSIETTNARPNFSNNSLEQSTYHKSLKDGSYSYNLVLGKSPSDNKLFENTASSSIKTSNKNSLKASSKYRKVTENNGVQSREDEIKNGHISKTSQEYSKTLKMKGVLNPLNQPSKLDIESIGRLVSKKIKEQILLALKPKLVLSKNSQVPDVRNLSREDKLNLNKLTDKIVMDKKMFNIQTAVPNKITNKDDSKKTQKKIYIKTFPYNKNQLDCKTRKCVIKKIFRGVSKKFLNDEKEKLRMRRLQLAASKQQSMDLSKVPGIIGVNENEFNSNEKPGEMKIYKGLEDVSHTEKKAITLSEAFKKRINKTNSNNSERPLAGHLLLEMMVNDLDQRSKSTSILEDIKRK